MLDAQVLALTDKMPSTGQPVAYVDVHQSPKLSYVKTSTLIIPHNDGCRQAFLAVGLIDKGEQHVPRHKTAFVWKPVADQSKTWLSGRATQLIEALPATG